MKIGILTFHYGSNYGGVLQCYALQQVLKNMGHDVVVINYHPNDSFKKYAFVIINLLKKRDKLSWKALWHFVTHHRYSRRVFRTFQESYLQLSEESSNINDFIDLDIDTIVVGSDQVWNYSQQKRIEYFLGWLKNPVVIKISYAACCGHNRINNQYRTQLIEQLNDFKAISVRSPETQDFINELIGVKPPVVADPTMLYDFKEFVDQKDEKYILTYILTEDIKGGNSHAIDRIKSKYPDMPVYSIVISDRQPRLCLWADKQLFDVSPNEWVNLIYNCSFLYTDSFHGAVFALKFGKPFIAYYSNEGSGKRLIDLKRQFDLKNIATNIDEVKGVLLSDMTTPQYDIDEFQSKSVSFLKNSIC